MNILSATFIIQSLEFNILSLYICFRSNMSKIVWENHFPVRNARGRSSRAAAWIPLIPGICRSHSQHCSTESPEPKMNSPGRSIRRILVSRKEVFLVLPGLRRAATWSFLLSFFQKGGVPAAPSGTATLLRLSPNHQFRPRPILAVTDFRRPRLSWLDGRCVQGPGTYSPRHG